MNQRHIHDDGYSFQDPLINNLNNKKVFEAKKQNFSNEDRQYNNNNNNIRNESDTTRCVNNISIENNDLIGNLEEFGISQYEAQGLFNYDR